MGLLSRISSIFNRGDGDAFSVPAMDGVLKPNTLLDSAEHLLDVSQIDNLVCLNGQLYCSSANALLLIDPGLKQSQPVLSFDGPITAIAASADRTLAIAIEGVGVALMTAGTAVYRLLDLPGDQIACVTAALFEDDDTILLTLGSALHAMSDWKRDLMGHGTTGSVVRHRVSTGATEVIRNGLAFPYGMAFAQDGKVLVSESWRYRIVSISSQASLLAELPAYPARLSPASDGGHWLALFAPRRQLTELVLREDDYRTEMMATIPPDAWIGPDFSDGGNDEQPLQSGSVRQMGVMKPWAPSRSYGLVVRLDSTMVPVASYHSRADGRIHGIASVVELNGFLYIASRGAGALLRLDLGSGASV
ncbi:SMP-30/gluconolactonase/LRE family protein [Pararhizobium qamdonense]|uniref:hypothetical protein n=1 Tax=Pararhizobium qamdonense TaxID=3031126 RepID=UPI0023E19B47|nr:hypothetical protein [Pararhizobium qamdonense]